MGHSLCHVCPEEREFPEQRLLVKNDNIVVDRFAISTRAQKLRDTQNREQNPKLPPLGAKSGGFLAIRLRGQ